MKDFRLSQINTLVNAVDAAVEQLPVHGDCPSDGGRHPLPEQIIGTERAAPKSALGKGWLRIRIFAVNLSQRCWDLII